jgi:RNA polymerase sigma-70 factor (ECF subfamily)
LTGDWDLAEECAQDAFVQAWERWPMDGVPERPGAWLTTTARNRALDRLRRASLETTKNEHALAMDRVADGAVVVTTAMDDQLCLIFTCCHPALAMDARVALTLRSVAGLRTAEIARAFLVSEHTMRQRLFRAKAKIRDAAIPFCVPGPDQLAARLDDVLAVLYFVFNEGYHASEGDAVSRVDVSHEAIRLTTLLGGLMPDEPEVDGLRVLMELHDARRDTRVDSEGGIVPLEDQDRTRWDHDRIDAAVARLDAALERRRPGPYQVQAAIAACHATAPTTDATDWSEIASLYGTLATMLPSPVVELNRAVAIAMADGPVRGLRLLDEIEADGRLANYYLLPAARADLLRRLGRDTEAIASYEAARALATNAADRRFLEGRIAVLRAGGAR